MKTYTITVTETLIKDIEVKARSAEMALQMVRDGHKNSEYVLTADDFDDVRFKIEYPPLNRDRDSR